MRNSFGVVSVVSGMKVSGGDWPCEEMYIESIALAVPRKAHAINYPVQETCARVSIV
jgi:hypothetical protein